MAKISAGDLPQADLVRAIRDLQVKALELLAQMRALTFAITSMSTSSTTLTLMGWTGFPLVKVHG